MSDQKPRRDIIISMSGINAATVDQEGVPAADADGHVVTAAVTRTRGQNISPAPVRAAIDHGVAPATAVSMLRKMADLIEGAPGILSDEPGVAVRLTPLGGVERRQVTPEMLREAAEQFGGPVAQRLLEVADLIEPDPPFPDFPIDPPGEHRADEDDML